MDFLILNVYLFVVCVLGLPILRLAQKWPTSSLARFFLPKDESVFIPAVWVAVSGIAFLYIAGAWSAFCLAIARTIIDRKTVTWDWLYLCVSFVWCVLILSRGIRPFSLSERIMPDPTLEEDQAYEQTHDTYMVAFPIYLAIWGLAVLAWGLFAVWPRLMLILYGWILGPLTRAIDRF